MNKPLMQPPPGERLLRFVGDTVRFTLRGGAPEHTPSHSWQAKLRTNLGRAELLRAEIIKARFHGVPFAGASWRDLPMHWHDGEWSLTLPLAEVGFFKAKAYAINPQGFQVWPDGPDFGVSVHPDAYRTANTIYCAFPRMFGPNKTAASTIDEKLEARLNKLDEQGYTVIPPSGKLRDVVRELPHIFGTLGCRILHLLPVNPTPTTYARMGRFGSPYACGDLTAIDPALVEFDKRTTGIDQFCELTCAAHSLGGKVFLDLVINHTGWGAPLQENHPEWYLRDAKGNFVSPGAWGNIWADLVELEHKHPELWEHLAEVFLTWCRRGVDGFRCDAGYKVPMPAWQYITARVRQEFPDAVFLLEGLGGGWADTENLITEGGMQWAYSELFQNYSGTEVANYLDYSLHQSERVGLYAHYSETHDNNRLAAKSSGTGVPPVHPGQPLAHTPSNRAWSLLRNRLCALASSSGGFGFTNGVEWLAAEKVNVHFARGMSWGCKENIIPELARLNQLLAEHPCFFDGAKLTRLSTPDSSVFALRRDSAEGQDTVLVLVNNDAEKGHTISLDEKVFKELGKPQHDLLGQSAPHASRGPDGKVQFQLKPAACFCLAATEQPHGLSGDSYRRTRAQAAWGLSALAQRFDITTIDSFDWRELAGDVKRSPVDFLARVQSLDAATPHNELFKALRSTKPDNAYPQVIVWNLADRRRVTPVPPNHWLLIEDTVPFRATLRCEGEKLARHAESIGVEAGHIACFPPCPDTAEGELILERFTSNEQHVTASVQFLAPLPHHQTCAGFETNASSPLEAPLALLTNGLGGMARVCVDLGSVKSKYDCVLAANLHASLPVDRHVFIKRVRVWCMADGFLTPLNAENLHSFDPGPPARWRFTANAGDGRAVEIALSMDMVPGENTVVLHFERSQAAPPSGCKLADECEVRLTVRFDIEDRNFHWETKRNGGAEHHFAGNCRPLANKVGFEFTPAPDRQLHVMADGGAFHHESEWAENIPHPVEQSRGQTGSGDAYSPGWFDVPLKSGAGATLVATAEAVSKISFSLPRTAVADAKASDSARDTFGAQLTRSARAFVVRRGAGKTVIAGYPWFLDWGRDTLIAARGLLAAGMTDEVREILHTFARFEENGTLPNTIHGENASNRDTSDAPLWFGVVCEELAALECGDLSPLSAAATRRGGVGDKSPTPKSGDKSPHSKFYATRVDDHGRSLADVLRSIAANCIQGTPNGIQMDAASGLIWSPSHFTWMDTNFPAGTPREGYPVEIQALWIRLLRQLAQIGAKPESEPWSALAERAEKSLQNYFWLESEGWFADVLLAKRGTPARTAAPDHALRSNCLFLVSLGLVTGERARRCVAAAQRHLVVPGALRSLAPLPVSPPLPIHGNDGRLLNDPANPYWGRYEGDEDTRRKPAYHNGTAWTWTFPTFCEALARAWDFSPAAAATAQAYLGGMEELLRRGCVGHLPEVVDGDAPHTQRGCDAQAWSATEALRVWKLFHASSNPGPCRIPPFK